MYFDIGSNIGNWSLANINNINKIISVEASPYTFEYLLKNCKNDKIILLNYAICNNNENDIEFYHAHANTLSTINKDWLDSPSSRFYKTPYTKLNIKTTTLDKLIEMYGMPELIKIDVEGGEYECIASLTKKVNMLCFEWASETNNITFKCLEYLTYLGFTQFYLQNGDNYIFRPSNYYDIITIKNKLTNTVPKKDWGMVWCK